MSERSFGRYRLLELLGQGGMGQVYRAHDATTDRIVALKILPPHESDDPVFQQRFRREAHTAASLTDPHVVPIHGYGEIDGRLYLDMRLIEGRDLARILKDEPGSLNPARVVHYIEQVAEALNAAHSAGLTHRDVKPSNIFVTSRDFVYLIDFGIAVAADATRMTGTGHAIGTFAYMAPERISVGQSEPRSDIYALACVLHECLTGQPPFGGESIEQQIAAHLMTPPPRPTEIDDAVPIGFDEVIQKGMAKNPAERYQTALELADAARQALTAKAGHTPPPRPPQRADRPRPRPKEGQHSPTTPLQTALSKRRAAIWAATAVAVVSVAAVVAIVWSINNSDQHASAAQSSSSQVSPHQNRGSGTATPELPAGVDALPPFKPPADLGSNCTYTTTSEQAAKAVTPPRAGSIPTNPATVSMTMTTNRGTIGLQLDNGKSPCTVNNFVSLAQKGFYDGTSCHRLTTGSTLRVLQCGDPKGDGTGGPGYQFADEYPTNQYSSNDLALAKPVIYPRGTLAMANAGPGTNGSQFFIVYEDSQLPPNYTVFGKVDDKSIGVIDDVAAAGTSDGSSDGKPKMDLVITSTRLD